MIASRGAEAVGGVEAQRLQSDIESKLTEAGVSGRVIVSGHGDVDVLPSRAGKGNAIARLLTTAASPGAGARAPPLLRLALTPSTRVVVCGDSGNDIDMFELTIPGAVPGFQIDGIAPSNAMPELVQYLAAAGAKGGRSFRAGSRCAAGVLEGLAHLGFL